MWAGTIMQASHTPLCQCTPFQNNSTRPCASPEPTPGSAGAPSSPRAHIALAEALPVPCSCLLAPVLPGASSPKGGQFWGARSYPDPSTVEPAVLAKVAALGASPRTLLCTGACLAAGVAARLSPRPQLTSCPRIGRAVRCLRGRCHCCQHLLWAHPSSGHQDSSPRSFSLCCSSPGAWLGPV